MAGMNRREFLTRVSAASAVTAVAPHYAAAQSPRRPNILFAIADDWSFPHASAYGAKGLETPAIDRVAREGCLFNQCFVAAPQCSPNRAAILTGRQIWQLEEAGTHASIFPKKHPVFTDLLEGAGYHVGFTGKGWGPGDWKSGGWSRNPAGTDYSEVKLAEAPRKGVSDKDYAANFEAFLKARPADAPFCFWYGCHEPHRLYEEGSGLAAGKKLKDVEVPGFLPDTPEVRSDMLDYFLEIEYFDRHLGRMLAQLEAIGELDNTLVVVTGDNGMSWPYAKANLEEYGIHVPLVVRWPEGLAANTHCDAPVSHVDLAPTFLQVCGLDVPDGMSGRAIAGVRLRAHPDGAPAREFALSGRERHTHARYDNLGYPARALRTRQYLYIRNFEPERWPAGDPEGYYDIDDGATKRYLLANRDKYPEQFALGFGKRPGEELYDVQADSACLKNLAKDPAHAQTLARLGAQLSAELTAQQDPRVVGPYDLFDSYPRISEMRPELGGFAERGKYNPKYQAGP